MVRGRSSRVEQAAHNRLVEGSNPSDPTKFLDNAVVRERLPDENVGVRHGAAILGCVLRLSQRIEVISK